MFLLASQGSQANTCTYFEINQSMGKKTLQNDPPMMAELGKVKTMAQPRTIYVYGQDSQSQEEASERHPLQGYLETAVLSIKAEPLGSHAPPTCPPGVTGVRLMET